LDGKEKFAELHTAYSSNFFQLIGGRESGLTNGNVASNRKVFADQNQTFHTRRITLKRVTRISFK